MGKRYFSVDAHTTMWEREVPADEVQKLWKASATEQTGHARDVEEIIMEEDDTEKDTWTNDQITPYMYRVGDQWTSIPKAFQSMTLHVVAE